MTGKLIYECETIWTVNIYFSCRAPPVPFSVFSKVVENLPDIAFQIQCNEPGAAGKSLDECALWYYNTFYSEPSVRTKYEYKLRSCPLRVKQKLLQGNTAGSSDEFSESNDIVLDSTEDGYKVTVNKWVEERISKYVYHIQHIFLMHRAGRFLFPVSLATFERYIHKTELLNMLVRKETKSKTKRAELLLDRNACRKLLRKYYNSFYINSSRRHMEICKFDAAPPALRQQLLKMGVPLDELAIKTMQMKSQYVYFLYLTCAMTWLVHRFSRATVKLSRSRYSCPNDYKVYALVI